MIDLYWLLRLPHIHNMIAGLAVVFFTVSFLMFVFSVTPSYEDIYDEERKIRIKMSKILFCMFLLFSMISCFVPDKTDVSLMLLLKDKNHENSKDVLEILKQNKWAF